MDLTLKSADLINPQTGLWKVDRVHQLFEAEDILRIVSTMTNLSRADSVVLSFSKDGSYSSKSGYSFLETLQNMQSGSLQGSSPIEKTL